MEFVRSSRWISLLLGAAVLGCAQTPADGPELPDDEGIDAREEDEPGEGGSGGGGGRAGGGGSTSSGGRGGAGGTMSQNPSPMPRDAGADAVIPSGNDKGDAGVVLPLSKRGTWQEDLTQGSGGPRLIEQTGGSWEGGWRVTSAKGDRLVFDLGRPIASGYLEVSVTTNKSPHSTPGKLNWAGLFERASLNQDEDGDIFYARVGATKYGFSRPKAAGHLFDMTEWEPSVGDSSDWVADDRTVHTVRFEWKNGQAIFHDSKGRAHTCPTSICGGQTPVDELRYVFLGADKWPRFNTDDPDNLSPVGMRFLRVKVVDTSP